MTQRSIVLASGSVHRSALLHRLLADFAVDPPEIDESGRGDEAPEAYVQRLAREKAWAVAERHPGALVIGSDQTCALGPRLLGKPGDHAAAVEQLLALSGQTVVFHTGLCLLDAAVDTAAVEVVATRATFRPLDRETVERYLAREPALDAAGSFHSEGLGIALLDRMETGDPTALVGLPLIRLAALLRRQGVPVP